MDNTLVFDLFASLIRGFGYDLLVTVLSVFFPLLVGCGLTVLMHFKRAGALPKVFRYLSVLTEGLAPAAVLLFCYFGLFGRSEIPPFLVASVALSVCFTGYMVYRYEARDSLLKNLLVNGIGLVADLLKWSFCTLSFITIQNVTRAVGNVVSRTYEPFIPYFVLVLFTFGILFVLHAARQILKDVLK